MKLFQTTTGILFLLLFVITACTTSKKIKPVPFRNLNEVLTGLHQNQIKYQYFSAKARIKYNGEESKAGGRSNIRMIKDSLIWMNFKKMSVEGARTLIRPDSCWVLYRFDDIYESGTTREFLDYYRIYLPFGELQNLLIGNFYIPKEQEVIRYEVGDYYHLTFQLNGDHYEYLINNDYRIFRILIRDTFGREMTATLTDYGEELIATHKEVAINVPGEGLSNITMKLSSIEFDIPKTIKFEIPDHYTRLP